MTDIDDLKRIPRFAGLSPEALDYVGERSVMRSYQRGEAIFHEGEDSVCFYMIVTGAVKISKSLESGREVILNIFRPGEAFGEAVMLVRAPFPATASALEPCDVLVLPREDYFHLLLRFPDAAIAVIRDLTLRVASMRRRVEQLGEGNVPLRIATLLDSFARAMGQAQGEDMRIPVQLTRNEIADLVGARAETVIRILSKWQSAGWLISVPDGFLAPQWRGLAARLAEGER